MSDHSLINTGHQIELDGVLWCSEQQLNKNYSKSVIIGINAEAANFFVISSDGKEYYPSIGQGILSSLEVVTCLYSELDTLLTPYVRKLLIYLLIKILPETFHEFI